MWEDLTVHSCIILMLTKPWESLLSEEVRSPLIRQQPYLDGAHHYPGTLDRNSIMGGSFVLDLV